MFVNGRILTGKPFDRVTPGVLEVRKYERSKCFRGYTLFSSAFGGNEFYEITPDGEGNKLGTFKKVLKYLQNGFDPD